MFRPCCIASIVLLTATPAGARSLPAPAATAFAAGGTGDFVVQQRQERPPGPANLEEAIEIVLERYGGQATRSETVVREGRRVHEIRVLGEDGSVRTVRVDPETGRIIPQRRNPG